MESGGKPAKLAELQYIVAMLLVGAVASVGMLAKKTTRFRSRADRDGGISGATEPSSQRKCARMRGLERRDERERRKARSEGNRAAVADEASVGHGGMILRYASHNDLSVEFQAMPGVAERNGDSVR